MMMAKWASTVLADVGFSVSGFTELVGMPKTPRLADRRLLDKTTATA